MIARTPTTADSARLWHLWLRIQRLIRVILGTRWNADEWPIVKAQLRNALDADRAGGLVQLSMTNRWLTLAVIGALMFAGCASGSGSPASPAFTRQAECERTNG